MDYIGKKNVIDNDGLSLPLQKVIGDSGPVIKAVELLKKIIIDKPIPDIGEVSASASSLIFVHLLNLLGGAGQLNATGYHSASITLLRPLEDAIDCFAAVCLVNGAAERWSKRELKASEAAKLWCGLIAFQNKDFTLAEYRKKSRDVFNDFSHCTPDQAHWNLYIDTVTERTCKLKLNTIPVVINSNGHGIDIHLIAHLYELLGVVEIAYSKYFKEHTGLFSALSDNKREIISILEEHSEHGCINIMTAPELKRIKVKNI